MRNIKTRIIVSIFIIFAFSCELFGVIETGERRRYNHFCSLNEVAVLLGNNCSATYGVDDFYEIKYFYQISREPLIRMTTVRLCEKHFTEMIQNNNLTFYKNGDEIFIKQILNYSGAGITIVWETWSDNDLEAVEIYR